jgi:hypothetical protein
MHIPPPQKMPTDSNKQGFSSHRPDIITRRQTSNDTLISICTKILAERLITIAVAETMTYCQ